MYEFLFNVAPLVIAVCAVASLSLEVFDRLSKSHERLGQELDLYKEVILEFRGELTHVEKIASGDYEKAKLERSWFVTAPFSDIRKEVERLLRFWKTYVPSNWYRQYLAKRIITLAKRGLELDPIKEEVEFQENANELEQRVLTLKNKLEKRVGALAA